jgi:hypothetical protein
MIGSTIAAGTVTRPRAASRNVTECATVKVVAASTTSRSRREPTMRARRKRMWSSPPRRCSAPRRKNSPNRSFQLCAVENDGCAASSAALPDRSSMSYVTMVLVSRT